MKATSALTLAIAAGCIASPALANNTPVKKQASMPAKIYGHIYFNLATGEKIATRLGDDSVRPAGGAEEDIVWLADNNTPCASFGQTSGTAVILDDPNGEYGTTSEGTTMLDWGDIPQDTVIDCITVDYFTSIEDTDTDSDSFGDGVEGFAATWAFYDGDNGFDSCFTRQGIVGFTIYGLSGQLDGPGGFGGYLFTFELANDFSSSISFEFGDSDSDPQGAAYHNPGQYVGDIDSDGLPDGDLDSDGLADFSYSILYTLPGRADVDNADGDSDTQTGIDGDPNAATITAVGLAAPMGVTVDNGDGTYSIDTTGFDPNAYGAEEGWDEFLSDGFYDGTYWMGGFTCNDPDDGTVNAFSQIDLILYSGNTVTEPECPADFTEDGVLDIFDVFAFLAAYEAGDASADFTNDGVFDIFDVFAFLAAYEEGCPA